MNYNSSPNENSGNFETQGNYNNESQTDFRIHDTNDFNFSKKTKIILIVVALLIFIAIIAMCFFIPQCREFMPVCLQLTKSCQNFACAAESFKRCLK